MPNQTLPGHTEPRRTLASHTTASLAEPCLSAILIQRRRMLSLGWWVSLDFHRLALALQFVKLWEHDDRQGQTSARSEPACQVDSRAVHVGVGAGNASTGTFHLVHLYGCDGAQRRLGGREETFGNHDASGAEEGSS